MHTDVTDRVANAQQLGETRQFARVHYDVEARQLAAFHDDGDAPELGRTRQLDGTQPEWRAEHCADNRHQWSEAEDALNYCFASAGVTR